MFNLRNKSADIRKHIEKISPNLNSATWYVILKWIRDCVKLFDRWKLWVRKKRNKCPMLFLSQKVFCKNIFGNPVLRISRRQRTNVRKSEEIPRWRARAEKILYGSVAIKVVMFDRWKLWVRKKTEERDEYIPKSFLQKHFWEPCLLCFANTQVAKQACG